VIATITYTRRPLWVRLLRPLACWYLRRDIASAEAYARNTRDGGVLTAEQVAQLRANITPRRALLVWWERS
jgi:hypothetical protein